MNKKGLEMAFSTIVVIILSLVLLILLIVFVTGGFKNFNEKISQFMSSSNIDSVVKGCNSLVMGDSKFDYCCSSRTIVLSSKEKYEMTCLNASLQDWGEDIKKLNCEAAC